METTPLHDRPCVPCEGNVAPMSPEEITRLAPEVPEWSVLGGLELTRRFPFPDFKSGLAFVDKVGALAEAEGHHPDIYLSWGAVEINISTHALGGLSQNDFILAAKISKLADTHPKKA